MLSALIMAGLKDIANACKVSTTTVSRVLNGDTTLSVSGQVRKAVLEEAARLGYKTPRQRKAPETAVALAVGPVGKPGYEEALLSYLQGLLPLTRLELFSLSVPRYDGILTLGPFTEDETAFYSSRSRALLMVDNTGKGLGHDSIAVSFSDASLKAIAFFLSKGIGTIGFIGGLFNRSGRLLGKERMDTFRRLLSEKGLCREEWFGTGAMDEDAGYRSVMALDELPGGLFLSDPETALGAQRALRERGSEAETVTAVDFLAPPGITGHVLTLYTPDLWRTAASMLSAKLNGEREGCLRLSWQALMA